MGYKILRHQICQSRKTLTGTALAQNSDSVFKQLLSLTEFHQAQSIGTYMAMNGEIETTNIIQHCWDLKKHVYIPKILPRYQMQFSEYTTYSQLKENQYKILEPEHGKSVHTSSLDIVIVPLVAF